MRVINYEIWSCPQPLNYPKIFLEDRQWILSAIFIILNLINCIPFYPLQQSRLFNLNAFLRKKYPTSPSTMGELAFSYLSISSRIDTEIWLEKWRRRIRIGREKELYLYTVLTRTSWKEIIRQFKQFSKPIQNYHFKLCCCRGSYPTEAHNVKASTEHFS